MQEDTYHVEEYIALIGNLLNSSLTDETVCKKKLINIEHVGE